MFQEFLNNVQHNLFKPLLLFFYAGFSIPLLGVPFVFPHVLYEGLTMYLLIAIGWHGGEELASMNGAGVRQAIGFMLIGFCLNFVIGCFAYILLRKATRLRNVDAATVAGYYGSDSAGTFVTCLGVLGAVQIAYAAYMPVMLAVMEIPGCLVALFLVSRLRRHGMDQRGNMPDEVGYDLDSHNNDDLAAHVAMSVDEHANEDCDGIANGGGHGSNGGMQVAVRRRKVVPITNASAAVGHDTNVKEKPNGLAVFINWELLHEVLFNPGLYLLFVGIVIGYISRLQGTKVTKDDDFLFVTMFQGALCLFLLEMGMTACKRLRDLRTAGIPFIAFGLIAPNIFATIGIFVAHGYSATLGEPFDIGTYVLFSVLCAAASYIAVPAVQRLAIPEASPTLPLAASLGLTFSYNVTIGIPVYIEIAKAVTNTWPVVAAVVN
jgi:hypothetical protein